jgi:AP-2 complex subunit alpha
MDPELQQRACEYMHIANLPTQDLLQHICDEMPPFPERASPLLSRLHSKHANTGDRRVWAIGGKDANADAKEIALQATGTKRSFTNNASFTKEANGATNGHDLAGLDMNGGAAAKAAPNFASAAHLSADWERGYTRLLTLDGGVLYEDAQIQIGLRSEYRGSTGCLILYFTNKFAAAIKSFTTVIDNKSAETLKSDVQSLPDTTIQPNQQTQQTIFFEAKGAFADAPTIRITYMAGALQALTLQLPVTLHKYMSGAELAAEDFFKRWKQIGGGTREAQKIFEARGDISTSFTRQMSEGFKWGVLDGVDPNSKNIVGASVLRTSDGGNFGCLMRLEPNYETKVSLAGSEKLRGSIC